jgi:hypothetical protein
MLAVLWHLIIVVATAALLIDRRPSYRAGAMLLVLLPCSVSVLAFAYGNPFNGAMFALLAMLLASVARRLESERVRAGAHWASRVGAAMLVYALVYPHFLEGHIAVLYAIASPVGMVPCPTLAALFGFTLLSDMVLSRRWAMTLAAFGLFYGLFGMLRLGVVLDAGLLFGVVALVVGAGLAPRRAARVPASPGTSDIGSI